ncbi:UNVERIFIED_CONTAM: hypothetical protein Slati_2676500 [Sesamum latifolium]|uniref:Reverse transcriptase domain-containing protein n=1 Tax=Sesamum latifolium TaxID=2727402 RepID=A0AAW2VV29_9LAMI
MDVKQLDEGRILLRLKHIIEKQRAQEGCPWSFEKNILILKPIGELENPMHVALDDCDFYTHVHDLPLSMMNLGMTTLISNRFGSFRDLESDDTGCSWGATMRIWVSLNVHQPLKRALKLRSPTGKELVGRFTYERLPNFCYLCGRLGHIDKAPIPGANRTQVPQPGKPYSSRGFYQQRPPAHTGAVVLGILGARSGQWLVRTGTGQTLKGQWGKMRIYFRLEEVWGVGADPRGGLGGAPRREVVELQCWKVMLLLFTMLRDGLGPPWTVRKLKELIQLHKPGLVFLSETKCKTKRCARIKKPVNYNGIGVDSIGKGGGLFLLWRKDVEVWLQSFSAHHIDATVKSEECKERWRFTGFYGYPEVCNRRIGWDLLRRLAGHSSRSWICVGDFNEILEQHEKQGNIPRAQWQMQGFRECLADCDLQDLGFKGDIFTWCNRRETPNTVWACLDRACGNQGWIDLFPKTTVTHEFVACSDHSVIRIGLEDEDQTENSGRQKHRFRFEAAWISAPDYVDVIKHAWESIRAPLSHTLVISKIQATRMQLTQWNNASFAGKEEILWKQRGKTLWLEAGDRNTSFFHVKAIERRQRKEIKRINDENGTEVRHKKGIQKIVLDYFRSIFSSTNPTPEAVKEVLECVEHHVTPAMNDSLTQSFTSEEFLPLKRPFVLGRLITDNVLVAYELNHFLKLKTRGKNGFISLKLDVSKAYDRVEWRFLESVLIRLGFHPRFFNLIMICVSSVSFSFLLNEAFSGMIRNAERAGLIQGIAVSHMAPLVSHLLFADDTLIFCQATEEALQCIKDILLSFEQSSGFQINLHKSGIVFSRNVNEEQQRALAGILEVTVVPKHDKYLGLPTIAGRSKKELFAIIKDRVWRKVHSWSTKKLSQAGQAVLIKTVLQTIPTYAMSYFRLPVSFLKVLESTMAAFLWHGGDVAKIHWKAWLKLCKFRKVGGLGFWHLKEHNIALLAKQAWRIAWLPLSLQLTNGTRLSFELNSVRKTRNALGIKLRATETTDELVWHYERRGTFSVKTLILWRLSLIPEGSCSQTGHAWNYIWKAKVLLKIALFAWRCVNDALLTNENLKRRGIPVSNGYVSCSQDLEDILHVLLACSFTRLVWAVSGLPWYALSVSTNDVERYFQQVHSKLSRTEWKLFLSICWSLWGARNRCIFENRDNEVLEVVRIARRMSGINEDVLSV